MECVGRNTAGGRGGQCGLQCHGYRFGSRQPPSPTAAGLSPAGGCFPAFPTPTDRRAGTTCRYGTSDVT